MAGAVKWAFAPNWTAKVEYQYWGRMASRSPQSWVADGFVVNNPHVQTVMVRVNDLFH